MIVLFTFNKPKGRFNIVWQSSRSTTGRTRSHSRRSPTRSCSASRSRPSRRRSRRPRRARVAVALVRYRFRGGGASTCCSCCRSRRPRSCWARRSAACSSSGVPAAGAQTLGSGTIVIAHIMFCICFVALTVKARIRGFDWTLEDAAMDLGATPWRTFSRVTLPLIAARDPRGGAAVRSRCRSTTSSSRSSTRVPTTDVPAPDLRRLAQRSSRRRSTCWRP